MTRNPPGKTIFVADDEPEVLGLMRMVLEWENYTVLEAADGWKALEMIQASRPDLALLDVRMPKLDGLNVLARLQADPELASIPVVMLSVVTTYPQVKIALGSGAVAYLPKPFEIRELTRLVEQILSADAKGRQTLREHAMKSLDAER